MSSSEQPKMKCCIEGCVNVGQACDGYDFFLCDRCIEELDCLISREYEKRVFKMRVARLANN